jgi:hypothetical protein
MGKNLQAQGVEPLGQKKNWFFKLVVSAQKVNKIEHSSLPAVVSFVQKKKEKKCFTNKKNSSWFFNCWILQPDASPLNGVSICEMSLRFARTWNCKKKWRLTICPDSIYQKAFNQYWLFSLLSFLFSRFWTILNLTYLLISYVYFSFLFIFHLFWNFDLWNDICYFDSTIFYLVS